MSSSDFDTRWLCEQSCTDCGLDGVCDPTCPDDPDCDTNNPNTNNPNNNSHNNAPQLSDADQEVAEEIIEKKKLHIIEVEQEVPESIGRELPAPLVLPKT